MVLITTSLVCCSKEDKYLKLITEENEILNHEIDRNYRIISTFSDKNKNKYGLWKTRCEKILKLRDNVLNNKYKIETIKYAIDSLNDFTKWFGPENDVNYIQYLDLNFDINDKIENAIFINKFLTVSNSYINKIIFMSNVTDFRFTTMNSLVITDKTTYNLGEVVNARIFISASDTTVKPKIIINNNEKIDTFDVFQRGIYKTKASKKGINYIKGYIVINHDYMNWEYYYPFKGDYNVK